VEAVVEVATMTAAAALRCALAHQAKKYAEAESIPHCFSYGDAPAVCFFPYDGDSRHGNFLDRSYQAIQARPEWRKHLTKVHTLAKRSLPVTERGRWMELDMCMSSDALLMNIFCHPHALRNDGVLELLGAESAASPIFGYRAYVPLANGRFDRTEVDMRLGDLLIEAKLTESDFQSAEKETLLAYRDFVEVFDRQELPQTRKRYASYQLIRNVLAAYALGCSFCVLVDTRRADLSEHWYAVMRCVKPIELRTRLRICTWQELAQFAPPKLRGFLGAKYGID
jgi:hypothetical protein